MTLLTGFSLTVLFDMVIAVDVGMGLAAILFIRRSIALYQCQHPQDQPERTCPS